MKSKLSDSEIEKYSRQIVLSDIGYDGQLKLRNSKACVIGLGGLGSKIALQLVGMGIGYIRLVDRDIVSHSDLHRQYLYDSETLGRPKVDIALGKLKKLNPDVEMNAFPESLNTTNAVEIITGVDIVLDGLDRPEPRYLVNRTCFSYKIPYIFGAATETSGNVSTIIPGRTFCLECIRPGRKDEDAPKAADVGVDPSVLGVVTSVQVSEAVKLLTGREPRLLNRLMYINLRDLDFKIIEGSPQEKCPVCGTKPLGPPDVLQEKYIIETLSRDGGWNFTICPKRRIDISLEKLNHLLKEKGFQIRNSGISGITFEKADDITLCILKSGTMVVQASPRFKGNPRAELLETYRSLLVDGLHLPENILPE